MDLKPYYQLVENCITRLGVDPKTCQGKKAGQWNMSREYVKIWIDLLYLNREKRPYFQVMAPIISIPKGSQDRMELYEDLLRINDRLFGVSFTLYHGWIWLKVIREVEGMDEHEAFSMLLRVENYANRYIPELASKHQKAKAK